jgi:hypothetical protein
MFRSTLLALPAFVTSALALVHATDSATLVSVATFQRAKSQGFTKAIPRGYQEACGIGGRVDPNFVQTYKNARAAGITDIDAYWFPCTGASNSCKSYSQQLSELGQTFFNNQMQIGTVWVDLEADSICNNWNYGTAGNLAEAKKIVQAAKDSGYNFGIYSSPGEWEILFGSRSVVLDNTAPLWFATFNGVETLDNGLPFGGWTVAAGHQYTDQSASGQFDLSVFAN